MHNWSRHEIDYLRSISWGRTRKEITEMFNNHFKLDIPLNSIVATMKRNNIQTGRTGQFEKGNIPYNKGKKMSHEVYEKAKATMFKKGNKPFNYRPIGSERVTKDGYYEVKVADPGVWKLKQRYIWEQHYGKEVPKDGVIIFLDDDKSNFEIENLKLISRKESLYMNKNKLRFKDRDTTDAAVNIAKLAIKTREMEKDR